MMHRLAQPVCALTPMWVVIDLDKYSPDYSRKGKKVKSRIKAFKDDLYLCMGGKVFRYDYAKEEWKKTEGGT